MNRLLAGVLVAPLASAPVIALIFWRWASTHGGPTAFFPIVLQTLAVTYPAMVLFGLPIHLALARQRYRRWSHYAMAGALTGSVPVVGYCLVAIVFEAKFAVAGLSSATMRNAAWGGIGVVVFGAVTTAVAVAFWQVAVRPPQPTTSAAASPS